MVTGNIPPPSTFMRLARGRALLAGAPELNRLRPHGADTVAVVTGDDLVQADADADGFIPVPYAAPLATGEFVKIVHTELDPAALASLGVSVDPSWTTQLPADLMEGEDGMPRAVRVSSESSEGGGF